MRIPRPEDSHEEDDDEEEGEKMKTKIVVRPVPNTDILHFHVTTEISAIPELTFLRPLRPTSRKYLKAVGPIGTKVVTECLSIPGVAEVTIKPYSLTVEKAVAFEWPDIEPQIINVLRGISLEDPQVRRWGD